MSFTVCLFDAIFIPILGAWHYREEQCWVQTEISKKKKKKFYQRVYNSHTVHLSGTVSLLILKCLLLCQHQAYIHDHVNTIV